MSIIKKFEKFINTFEFNFGNINKEDISKIKNFIEDLNLTASKNNIQLNLSNTNSVSTKRNPNVLLNGYFDDENRVLACSMGKDVSEWLPLLLHESSHMDQFIDGIPEWNNITSNETDNWLDGKSSNMDIVNSEINTAIDIELDCEKRTVNKIKKYKLENIIDINNYIQKANAYILFYLWMKKNRKWYTMGKEPYNIPEIVSSMPSHFNVNYRTLNIDTEKLFNKYLV